MGACAVTPSGTRQSAAAPTATAEPASSGWLARIAKLHANDLLAVRLVAGVEICVQEEWAWVRGPQLNQALEQTLRTIPGLIRCTGLPGGPATVSGRQMPSGVVPASGWSPLRASVALAIPRPALPGQPGQRSALRLVRSRIEQPCSLLRCTWAEVAAWVETAPEHRLSGLRFAATAGNGGEAILRGQPLPLLHGVRHWQLGPLALPAGWTIDPPLTADDAFALTGAGTDDVVLVDNEEKWHAIDAGTWMHVTRSAIRATGAAHE